MKMKHTNKNFALRMGDALKKLDQLNKLRSKLYRSLAESFGDISLIMRQLAEATEAPVAKKSSFLEEIWTIAEMTAFEELLRSHPNVTAHDIRRLSTPDRSLESVKERLKVYEKAGLWVKHAKQIQKKKATENGIPNNNNNNDDRLLDLNVIAENPTTTTTTSTSNKNNNNNIEMEEEGSEPLISTNFETNFDNERQEDTLNPSAALMSAQNDEEISLKSKTTKTKEKEKEKQNAKEKEKEKEKAGKSNQKENTTTTSKPSNTTTSKSTTTTSSAPKRRVEPQLNQPSSKRQKTATPSEISSESV